MELRQVPGGEESRLLSDIGVLRSLTFETKDSDLLHNPGGKKREFGQN